MHYILDDRGYVKYCSNTYITCENKTCTPYEGTIPDGYETIEEWVQNANIRAYKIENGNLRYDRARDSELQKEYANCCLVVSNIKCKNLFNINALTLITGSINKAAGTITVNQYPNQSEQTLKTLAPDLVAGKTYALNAKTTGAEAFIYLQGSSSKWYFGQSKQLTQEEIDNFIIFYGYYDSTDTVVISEIQIEEGYNVTEYSPYKEFSNQIHYSMVEQVIGTWSEGETLYRKVISGVTASERTSSIFLGNKIIVRNFYGLIYYASGSNLVPLNYSNPNATIFSYIHGMDECYLNIEILNEAFYNCEFFAVVEYIEKTW